MSLAAFHRNLERRKRRPFLIDNNLFLSAVSLADWSQGGAYAHNIFAGKILARPELGRETPWLEEHGTKIAGLQNIKGHEIKYLAATPPSHQRQGEQGTDRWLRNQGAGYARDHTRVAADIGEAREVASLRWILDVVAGG